jgi:hypothetical protein
MNTNIYPHLTDGIKHPMWWLWEMATSNITLNIEMHFVEIFSIICTLSWLRANQSLLLLLNTTACGEATNTNFIVFGFTLIVFNASHDGSRFTHVYNFITSLDKLLASQQVFIAISRICIIGLGLLDMLLIGTTITNKKLIR